MLIGSLIPWRNRVREVTVDEGAADSVITRFHSEMDRLFERFFGDFWGGSRWFPELRSWTEGWSPSLDVSESEEEITVRAELPGVDPKDIDVSISGDVLIISGAKREESEKRGEGFYHTERRFGVFRRSIPLTVSVDPDKISAEYERGVLTVRLRKSEKAVAKRIPVSVSRK